MVIGERSINAAITFTEQLLHDHHRDIDNAFSNIEGELTVSMPVKFKLKDGGVNVHAGISFKTGECKGSLVEVIDEHKRDMFDERDARREVWLEILFRDFEWIKKRLEWRAREFDAEYRRCFVFNKYKRHSI